MADFVPDPEHVALQRRFFAVEAMLERTARGEEVLDKGGEPVTFEQVFLELQQLSIELSGLTFGINRYEARMAIRQAAREPVPE